MTDWQQIARDDFAVPEARRDVLAAELAEALADADPQVRDGAAYAVLATWISRGDLDDQLDWLGDMMAARLGDPRIQARTFAALVLAWVIERGGYAEEWVSAAAAWYPAETDLRGYDPDLGWLHAVAHGADLLGVLGRHQRVRPELMLDLAASRMLAPTEYVWRDQEDDRLGCAIALILTRPELTVAQAVGWLDGVDARFAVGEPGPVPAFASNAMRTLRVLYLLADRGVRPEPGAQPVMLSHRDELLARLAATLATVAWFTG